MAKAGHGNEAKSVLEQARREANEWSESNSDKKGSGKRDRVSLASFPEEFVEVGVVINDEKLIEEGIDMAERIARGAARRVVKRRMVESLAASGHLRRRAKSPKPQAARIPRTSLPLSSLRAAESASPAPDCAFPKPTSV